MSVSNSPQHAVCDPTASYGGVVKFHLSTFIFLLCGSNWGLFAQSYQWANSFGSAANDDYGNSVAVDALANVYVTGWFEDTVDFDPGAGAVNLISVGVYDIFIAKYDSSGTHQWAFNIGGKGLDYGLSVTVGGSGDVYITGVFSDTADFDPGAGTANLTSIGGGDIFVAKYNSSGAYQWAFNIESRYGGYSNSVTVGGLGDVYITGSFNDSADFDPGAGIAVLTTTTQDIFVAKYDSSGTYQWAFNIGSTGYDRGYSIAADVSGNICVTGQFRGTADFDPGASTVNLTPTGFSDIFVAKYNSSGTYQWAFNIGSAENDEGHGIVMDNTGSVYVTGWFASTADFDPGVGTENLTPASLDIFVAKYNSSGAYQWAFNIGDTFSDHGASIAVDASGNIYVTGRFSGTADFDPGANATNLTSAGAWDIFVAKYNSSGAYQLAFNVGSIAWNEGLSVTIDASGNMYVTGQFYGSADFDPGAGTANLTSAGGKDIFLAKYSSIPVFAESLLFYENTIQVLPTISASGYFTVFGKGKVYITVYNALGQKLYSAEELALPYILDLSICRTGFYLLQINTGEMLENKKLFVVK